MDTENDYMLPKVVPKQLFTLHQGEENSGFLDLTKLIKQLESQAMNHLCNMCLEDISLNRIIEFGKRPVSKVALKTAFFLYFEVEKNSGFLDLSIFRESSHKPFHVHYPLDQPI